MIDWRGSSTRYSEGQYLLDYSSVKDYSLARPCEMVSVGGLAVCTNLSSVRSLWQTFTTRNASHRDAMGGVSLPMRKVTIVATCRVCRGHYGRSTNSYSVANRLSLWRNTELLMNGDISISLQIVSIPNSDKTRTNGRSAL